MSVTVDIQPLIVIGVGILFFGFMLGASFEQAVQKIYIRRANRRRDKIIKINRIERKLNHG